MSESTKDKCTMFIDRIDAKEFQETIFQPWKNNPEKNLFAAIAHADNSITVVYAIPVDTVA